MSESEEIVRPMSDKAYKRFKIGSSAVMAVMLGVAGYNFATAEAAETRNERASMITDFFEKSAGSGCNDKRAWPRVNAELKKVPANDRFRFHKEQDREWGYKASDRLNAGQNNLLTGAFKRITEEGYKFCLDKELNIESGNYRHAAVIYPAQKVVSMAPFFNSDEIAEISANIIEYIGPEGVKADDGNVYVLVAEGEGFKPLKARDYYDPLRSTEWQTRPAGDFPQPPLM